MGRGFAVLEIQKFSWHEVPDQFANFYSTYNRTKLQSNVRDLVTLCSVAGKLDPRKSIPFRVVLVGTGAAGTWSLLAAPAADAVVADLNGADPEDEATWLDPELFCPGILNLGGVEGAALLTAPRAAFLHHTGAKFRPERVQAAYGADRGASQLRVEPGPAVDEAVEQWLAQLKDGAF